MSADQEAEKTQVPVSGPLEGQILPASPKMILQELEKNVVDSSVSRSGNDVVFPVEPPPIVTAVPLITEAMRRLDDLLARFRN